MELLDIHTHYLFPSPEKVILNCTLTRNELPSHVTYCSIGIHPWDLLDNNYLQKWDSLLTLAHDSRVIAIGEAGLDKRIAPSLSLQLDILKKQIQLADSLQKPLIIHCVRSANELIALKKEMKPLNPWIIHGFRGKKELALEYVKHGFYLSFGENYLEESLRAIPLDHVFLETDESAIDISFLYSRVAESLGVPLDTLMNQVQANIKNIFGCI